MAKGVHSPAIDGEADTAAPAAERLQPYGKRPLRTFVLAVVLPALLLYAGIAVLVVMALVTMAKEIDRLENDRGITAVHAALDSFLNGLSDNAADEGTWNEAYLNVVIAPDPAWMDSTWGTTARLGASYDDVMVTDQAGLIVFGENNLGPIKGNIATYYPAAANMLKELDKAISLSGDAAVISYFASDSKANTAGLAAISIHRTTPGEMNVPRQTRRVLWIAKRVTPALLQDIAVRYQTPMAELVKETPPGSSSIDLADFNGNVAGTVAWMPDRPGEAALRHTLLIVSAVFLGIGLLLVFSLGLLRRSMVRRAARIEAAFADHTRAAEVAVAVAAEVATRPTLEEHHYTILDGVTASDFIVEYQPVFDLRSETMLGVDALLRWTRADKSLLLQEQLSPAECAVMMERLAIIALRHATGELAPLLGVVLTLSITAEQLQNDVFAEKIAGTLGATNFPSRRLQLSVDTTLLPDAERLAAPIAELRQSGVSIALSNFTLGPNTIGYVRPGLADRICLSPSMLAGIDTDPIRMKLIEATIEAARSVSFAVTVPGIERKEEAAKLLRLGCREFRGPLVAKPMSIAALTSLILSPAKPQPVRQAS